VKEYNQSNHKQIERLTLSLHPSIHFTSGTIAEMLKNRGMKRHTSREVGSFLPILLRENKIMIVKYNPKVYRNKMQVMD
jgi:hypothetical protein